MDIDEALRVLRESTTRAQRLMDADTGHAAFCEVDNGTVSAMVDAWRAVDEWLSQGGYLPNAWAH